MGLALDLHDEVEVLASPRKDPDAAAVHVEVHGEGAAVLPTDATHLVVTAVEKILAAHGWQLPDLHVQAQNVIPHSRGLGSSAAAITTAVLTASTLIPGGLSADEQLQVGSRMEGHPDNYVPALRGGVAISWERHHHTDHQEKPRPREFATAALSPHRDLRCVVAIPNFVQSTQAARGLLPETVPHAEAASNSARAALLTHALTTQPALLFEATEDRLHQQQRRSAFPESMALVDALREKGHAAVISGAGPTVLVFTSPEATAAVSEEISNLNEKFADDRYFTARELAISSTGATVELTP